MKEKIVTAGFFVLRTPILPWDEIEGWCQGLLATRTLEQRGDVENALRNDTTLLRNRLREFVRRDEVRSALYIASPSLHSRLGPWLDGDDSPQALSVEPTIVRYIMRMAGRATPFGLFAGTSIGTLGKRTHLSVAPRVEHRRHTRLDMEYVFKLAEYLSKDAAIQPLLRYRATSVSYIVDGRLRYYEPHFSGKLRTYHLVDVESTPYLHKALDFARTHEGATISAIAAEISSVFDNISYRDALEYVHELVDAKLLCSTLSPVVTGNDPVLSLIEQLRAMSAGKLIVDTLDAVLHDIRCMDAVGADVRPEQYEQIAGKLRVLPVQVDAAPLFRVDLKKPSADTEIAESVVAEVAKGFELLAGIAYASKESAMDTFVRDFELRYQRCEIPLVEALDEETGIGFDVSPAGGGDTSSLINGLDFRQVSRQEIKWNRREDILLQKLSDALRRASSNGISG